MRRPGPAHVLITLTLALALAPASALAAKQLRIRAWATPHNLDWTDAGSQTSSALIFANITEGLTRLDSKLQAQPALARSIEVSPDGKTYKFVLRPGVRWSDGAPLTAQQFIDSWKRLLNPLDVKAYAATLFNVVGAEDYHRGLLKDFSQVGVRAPSPDVLEITLKSPQIFFTRLLALPNLAPLRQDLVAKFGPSWKEPGKLAVIGPFIPEKLDPGKSLTLKRNPAYYGLPPRLDSVAITVVSADADARDALLRGELDVSIPINASDARPLEKRPELRVSPQYRTRYLAFNIDAYPISLPSVRQAIALALDRSKLAYIARHGYVATDTLVPRGLCAECADTGLRFNLAEARRQLEGAALTPANLAPIELVALSTDSNALATGEIAEQLTHNLGLRITPKLLAYENFLTQTSVRGGPIFYILGTVDYADPDAYLENFISGSSLNMMKWKNARYDELVRAEVTMPNGPERTKAVHEALQLLQAKDVAIVPLHFESLSYLVATRVKGFQISPLGVVDLREVDLATP